MIAIMTQPFRILSLDGGGIRGIMTIEMLDAIERQSPGFLSKVDLLAGTSTGGLIALALATNRISLDDLRRLYVTNGGEIFATNLSRTFQLIRNTFVSRYDNTALKKFIAQSVGDIKLGELPRKVLITSFDLTGSDKGNLRRWKAKFFHNLEGEDNNANVANSDWYQRVADVALYTASAPIYFPAANGYVDGGVVAPNPAMVALAQTQDVRYFASNAQHPARSSAIQQQSVIQRASQPTAPSIPSDIRLLSIGTGESRKSIARKSKLDWGFLRWIWPFGAPGAPLLSLMIEGDANVDSFECMQLLDNNFRRAQITLPPDKDYDMDQAANVPDMQSIAQSYTRSNEFVEIVNWAQTHW